MTAPLTADQAPVTRVRYLDKWDDRLIFGVAAPLVLWGAASVFMLAAACGIDYYIAWIPALATSGVMLSSTRLAMRHGMPAHIKRWATYLAAFAVFMEIIVAGLQHSLPEKLQPPGIVMFVIGCLPTLMGAATIKVWASAHAEQAAVNAAAEQAAVNAQTAIQVETARARAVAEAETARLAAQRQLLADQEAAGKRKRADEAAHARELAAIAQQTAQAEAAAAEARQRVSAAVDTPEAAKPRQRTPKSPAKLKAVDTDALGRVARPSPKRDAALRYLIAQYDAGRLDKVTGTEVDKHIGANAYARRYLDEWVAAVHEYVKTRGAA